VKYIWFFLKAVGYLVFAFFLCIQIIAFGSSSNTKEFFIRGSILLAVGLFFAIKWQRRNKPADAENEDKKNL